LAFFPNIRAYDKNEPKPNTTHLDAGPRGTVICYSAAVDFKEEFLGDSNPCSLA
jgi:hypothetical protein